MEMEVGGGRKRDSGAFVGSKGKQIENEVDEEIAKVSESEKDEEIASVWPRTVSHRSE